MATESGFSSSPLRASGPIRIAKLTRGISGDLGCLIKEAGRDLSALCPIYFLSLYVLVNGGILGGWFKGSFVSVSSVVGCINALRDQLVDLGNF